ncbi:unnamed protein product, partial [Symbiodinium necroappetens]
SRRVNCSTQSPAWTLGPKGRSATRAPWKRSIGSHGPFASLRSQCGQTGVRLQQESDQLQSERGQQFGAAVLLCLGSVGRHSADVAMTNRSWNKEKVTVANPEEARPTECGLMVICAAVLRVLTTECCHRQFKSVSSSWCIAYSTGLCTHLVRFGLCTHVLAAVIQDSLSHVLCMLCLTQVSGSVLARSA